MQSSKKWGARFTLKMMWQKTDGSKISCDEKLKILKQNFEEIKNLNLPFERAILTKEYEYALEDAMLFEIPKTLFDKNLQDFLKSNLAF